MTFFTFFCMQVSIMMCWIGFDLIFAMQVITTVFYIVLDFISTFFCMLVITMVAWTVLDLIFTFFCMQVIHILF